MTEVVKEEMEDGRMERVDIFLLTDNYVAETVYYQVKFSDKDIFELMIQLVYLEFRGCFMLHIIWVAGKR